MPQSTCSFTIFVQNLITRFNHLFENETEKNKILSVFEKNEAAYRTELLSLLNLEKKEKNKNTDYKAEIICCIDPRERNLRTIFESYSYKTYGYSGSLGLPLQVVDTIENRTYQSCPGWITPEYNVMVSHDKNKNIQLSFEPEIPFEKQYQYALQLCKTIGLAKSDAPFIIFMGHKGELDCKKKEQLLHCGACEGNPGEINNRVMASILQNPEIKKTLRLEGIDISDQTLCIAAEHNTNTGEITLLTENVNEFELLDNIKKISEQYVTEKLSCSGLTTKEDLLQPSPFVSLAGNKGMLIGPVEILKKADKKEKYFLQSYEYQNDPEGIILKNILTGPLRVALAINSNYLFSTIALQHNLKSDQIAIPKSLIFTEENKPYHQLMRFFVIIYAPQNQIEISIKNEPVLEFLIKNHWLDILIIDPTNKETIHFLYH